MSEQTNHPTIVRRVIIEELFGSHDIVVPFHTESPVTIIHGPNGVGKTVLLRLIQAVSLADVGSLINVPYKWMTITLADESMVTVTRNPAGKTNDANPRVDFDWDSLKSGDSLRKLISSVQARVAHFEEYLAGASRIQSTSETPTIQLSWSRYSKSPLIGFEDLVGMREGTRLERELDESPISPFTQISSNEWEDAVTGEQLPFVEVVRRHFGNYSNPRYLRWQLKPEKYDWSQELGQSLTTSLIGTNRISTAIRASRNRYRYELDEDAAQQNALTVLSESLRRKIQARLAHSVEESRRLDTEFIDKALAISQHVESAGIFEEDVLERVAALDDLRSRYVASGLLDVTPRRTVVSGLNVAQLALLQVHFETEHQKLILLEDIQQRMELLLELANAKFPDKRLSIDRSKGFVIKSRRGDVIPLHLLSSGEQHEIALLYRLLFQTPANTLVMIDEPEISLHTTWQQQFIDDLLRIAEITHCQYVVATHSPDLVGNHADMMIGLGD